MPHAADLTPAPRPGECSRRGRRCTHSTCAAAFHARASQTAKRGDRRSLSGVLTIRRRAASGPSPSTHQQRNQTIPPGRETDVAAGHAGVCELFPIHLIRRLGSQVHTHNRGEGGDKQLFQRRSVVGEGPTGQPLPEWPPTRTGRRAVPTASAARRKVGPSSSAASCQRYPRARIRPKAGQFVSTGIAGGPRVRSRTGHTVGRPGEHPPPSVRPPLQELPAELRGGASLATGPLHRGRGGFLAHRPPGHVRQKDVTNIT